MNESLPNRRNDLQFADTLLHVEVVLLAVVMTTICIVTIIGNTLVLVSFLLDKKLRTLNNYFILSLAVSDIMIGTFAMPLFTLYSLNGEWTFGPVLCDMWLAQDYMCSCASSLNLLMIAFDRYFSVVTPLRYRARKNGRLVAIMISSVWIVSFLLWPPWIYSWQYIEGERTVPDDDCYVQFLETNTYLTIATAAVAYYIPVSIICFLYYRIWRETVKRKQFLAKMESENNSIKSASLQTKYHKSETQTMEHSSKPLISNGKSSPQEIEEKVELVEITSSSPTAKLLSDIPNECGEFDCVQTAEVSRPSTEQSAGNKIPLSKSSSINNAKQDNKAARMLAAILCAFLITATPYNVIVVIVNLDYTRSLVSDGVWFSCYYMFYVNSALNPICYALANVQFRKTYWKILKCAWSRTSTDSASCRSSTDNKSPSKTFKTSEF